MQQKHGKRLPKRTEFFKMSTLFPWVQFPLRIYSSLDLMRSMGEVRISTCSFQCCTWKCGSTLKNGCFHSASLLRINRANECRCFLGRTCLGSGTSRAWCKEVAAAACAALVTCFSSLFPFVQTFGFY